MKRDWCDLCEDSPAGTRWLCPNAMNHEPVSLPRDPNLADPDVERLIRLEMEKVPEHILRPILRPFTRECPGCEQPKVFLPKSMSGLSPDYICKDCRAAL